MPRPRPASSLPTSWSRARPTRLLIGLLVVLAGLLSAAPGLLHPAATAAAVETRTTSSSASALAKPAGNSTPVVDYTRLCYVSRAAAAGAACQRALVTDINAARAREHVRPLVLPRGYSKLSAANQVFVLVNLERVDRGLKPVAGTNAVLNARAQRAAVAMQDPTIAGWQLGSEHGLLWASIQAVTSNALEADWLWMYSDGWAGPLYTTNLDCTGPRSSGCWGHRDNVLQAYAGMPILVSGTAAYRMGLVTSFTQLALGGSGSTPALLYTWKQALAAGADRH